MADAYARHGNSVIAVEDVPREQTGSYGIVAVDSEQRMQQIVEKPRRPMRRPRWPWLAATC